jgi:prepilin-type N-terminal cleavage/methylation domain-containing protein
MNVVRHNDVRVQFILTQRINPVGDRVDDDLRNSRFAQPMGSGCCLIEDGVGFREGVGRRDIGRTASIEAERHECRVVEQVNVGEVATVGSHDYSLVGSAASYSQKFLVGDGPGAHPTEEWSRRGVTLLEMLVVVGIVAILLGVSYPSIAASVDSVRLATAADSAAAFLNSALNRAEQRHQVLELTIGKRRNEMVLRSADPAFRRNLELPVGVKIAEVLPASFGNEDERVFYLIPGGSAPRIGVALVNTRGARRTVRIDPITSAPEISRE